MRKALPITLVFCLLTLSMAPFAMAQKQNIITNETTETLYVVYSTKFGAQGAIPDGYRTSGWKTIAAGQQRTFWAYDPHKVYFQIFKGSQPIKPERSTETFAFWINRNANFDIVTRQEINAAITRDQLLYSSHGTNPLTHRDGFMQYDNGSRITVTDAWVAVDADDFDPPVPDEEPTSPAVDDGSSDLPVSIPDPYLRDYIAASLDKDEDDPISQKEMLNLTDLDLHFGPVEDADEVADLTGLEFALNLEILSISGNISDISPLKNLVNLESLFISFSNMSDVSPLKNLVNLEYLYLSGNSISDVSPLAGLVNLTDLFLGENNISDVSPLAGLVNLTLLDLVGNSISDVSPLKDLVNLEFLDLGGNPVSNVHTVSHLTAEIIGVSVPVNIPDANLRREIASFLRIAENAPIYREDMLRIGGCEVRGNILITDLTGLEFAHKLRWLLIYHGNISDLSPLKYLVNLESLTILYGGISDVSPLKDLVRLETLELFGNSISDVSPLKDLVNLKILQLGNNNISDISPLKDLVNLETLHLYHNPVQNANTLSHLTADIIYKADSVISDKPVYIPDANLRRAIAPYVDKSEYDLIFQNEMLTLTHNSFQSRQIADLTGLEFAHNYTSLSLYGNSITDVSPLKDLVNLTDLDLWENAITDVSPLKDLVNLTYLDLSENAITDVSPLKDLVNLERLSLSGNSITDVSPLKDLVNLERLSLSGNSITDVSPLKDLVNLKFLELDSNLVHNANKTLSHLADKIIYTFDDSVISGEPVIIPDANLRRAIASQLRKDENDPISQKEMLNLYRLSAAEPVIADLTGLEFARNLGVLDIQGNISDVSPLKGLVNLKELSLSGNSISDVSPLKDLIYLKRLSLSGNSISDVSPLKDLVNLTSLYLYDNNISDVSPLKDLVNLQTLILRENSISDVSPLAGLVNLERLELHGNSISDVSPLKDLVNLQTLWLKLDSNLARNASKTLSHLTAKIIYTVDDSVISDEPVIIPDANLRREIASELRKAENDPISDREMLKLTSLNAAELTISDLTGLEFAHRLRSLSLWNNSISDVSPLKRLVNLTSLTLNNNNVSDVSPLKDLVNLERLHLSGNSISDVSPLKDLVKLTSLGLAENNVSDVSPLKDLINLTNLRLSDNNVSDISPLKDLVNLDSVSLSSNNISDVSPLNGLVNLRHLNLTANSISDVSPLKDLVKLEQLSLSNNNISDVSPLAGLVNLRELSLYSNPVKNADTLSGLTAEILGVVVIHSCGTLMPDTIEPIKPVQVYREYERTKVSPGVSDKVGLSGSTSAAVAGATDQGRYNRTWTVDDTMADESGTLVLTVKLLSASEASKLLNTYKHFLIETYSNGQEIYNENHKKYEGTFVDPSTAPTPNLHGRLLIDEIKRAARDWSVANIDWKFIEPGESGDSDIRIAFLDPEQLRKTWNSHIGSPSKAEEESYNTRITMNLSTDVSYETILHEFGHALGLTHEHLIPQFYEHFDWDDTEPDGWTDRYPDLKWDDIPSDDRIYKKIAFYFSGYNAETIEKGTHAADSIDNNFLGEDEIDELHSKFDRDSIMTYGLRPDLLKAKPNAPSWAKALVDGENASGIKRNTELSERDRQFITDLYGTALEKVEVSGSVHIVGEEHDWGEDPSLINRTKTVASAVHADALEYVRAYDPIIFKWGGEQRVEVHLHHRRIKNRDIEMAVNVLLYHGKGTDNTDLDDLDCRTFTLRAGQSSTGTANLDVEWLGGNAEPACGGLDIDVHASGLKGGDLLFWPNPNLKNKATVTIKLTASPVSVGTPIDAPAAPSIAAIVRMADPSHDVNGDGEINAADLLLVSQYFGRIPPETPPVDVNNDDTVTIADLVQVAQHLQLSPVPAAPSVSMPAGLTYRTVEGWIDTARVESDGSRAFKIGIANLEALLRLVVPEETALLHNYPNPFNPETWIPYHLSEPAHVDLTIYTVDGKVVRHLDLGHQVAGFYQSKARAAHWDGRNNVGERVASGVYFYTLTAGEFTATRKLLILK